MDTDDRNFILIKKIALSLFFAGLVSLLGFFAFAISTNPILPTQTIQSSTPEELKVEFSTEMIPSLRKNFENPELIYAHIKFKNKQTGRHQMICHWIRPDGQEQEETNLNLPFPETGGQEAYAWIKLKNSASIFGPDAATASYAHDHYNGPWNLKIFYDGHLVNQSKFSVYGL